MNIRTIFLLLVIAFVALMGCSNKNGQSLPIFNNASFKIYNGERERPIDAATQQDYQRYFGKDSMQIPLYKVVQHNTYVLYLGITYNIGMPEIKKYVQEHQDSTYSQLNTDEHSIVVHRSLQGYTTTECYFQIDSINTLYIAQIGNATGAADSLNNPQSLLHRIERKH